MFYDYRIRISDSMAGALLLMAGAAAGVATRPHQETDLTPKQHAMIGRQICTTLQNMTFWCQGATAEVVQIKAVPGGSASHGSQADGLLTALEEVHLARLENEALRAEVGELQARLATLSDPS